jgi:DNA-binding MarR family transcriptional regulator
MMDGWLNISELAALRGRNKAAVSRRVARMERDGLLRSRKGPGGQKLVNVEEFTRLADTEIDAVNEANGILAGAEPDPILHKEQARKTRIAADLAQIELDRQLGLLVAIEDVQSAARAAAERLRRGVEQMGSRAEDVAAGQTSPFAAALLAALRADPAGARIFFRALARSQLLELSTMALAFDADDAEDEPALAAALPPLSDQMPATA